MKSKKTKQKTKQKQTQKLNKTKQNKKQNKTKQNKTKQNKTKNKTKTNKNKTKTNKNKNKVLSSFCNFSSFHFQFSTFPSFLLHFPFCLASIFPVGQQKFSRQKSLGGTLPLPPPRLLRHCSNDNAFNKIYFKGMVSNTVHNIFFMPGISRTKRLFPKFQLIQVLRLQVMHDYVHWHNLLRRLLCENCSISNWNGFCLIVILGRCASSRQNWILIASSPYHMQRLQHHTLLLGDTEIYPSFSIRNLGVIFDQHMTMSEHVTQLCRSINWQIRNIYRFRRFIDFETCHRIVRSLVLSKLDYCVCSSK